MMAKQHQVDMYIQFRQELDKMCVPLILDKLNFQKFDIECDNKVVGIFVAAPDYIDCLYVEPEYRRKGLGAKVVTEWVRKYGHYGIRLHIINNNYVAQRFWNSLFELKEIGSNEIDTLYEIVRIKEDSPDE